MKITGYKGFDKDFKCRGFQYEVGKEYVHDGDVKLCESGFHFCEYPLDVFNYYNPADSRFAVVSGEPKEKEPDETSDTKIATDKLTIEEELSLPALSDAAVKFTLSRVRHTKEGTNTEYQSAATNTGDYSAATNTGDQSAATNTGDQSAATNTGDHSAATNTGYQSAATNTGNYSAATNTGNYSAATNTGNRSAATNTGYQSAATNTGDRSAATNTGKQGVAVSIGIEGKAKGAIGCWLTLAEWKQDENGDWNRADVQTKKVDGKHIKADTFYVLKGGKFVEQ